MERYEACLADYEPVLPALARLLGATFEPGSFAAAEDRFHARALASEDWRLEGPAGRLVVRFEQYEGYYFATFEAAGATFEAGRALLGRAKVAQGGRPDA